MERRSISAGVAVGLLLAAAACSSSAHTAPSGRSQTLSGTVPPPPVPSAYMVASDNFTHDSSLHHNLWTTHAPLLLSMGTGSLAQRHVPPTLSFGPSGMTMSGVNGSSQYTGVQLVQSLHPPFTVTASVRADVANGDAFAIYLAASPRTWVGVEGNVNSANRGYYGINLVDPSLIHIYSSPTVGTRYVIKLTVDALGAPLIMVTSRAGKVLGTAKGPSLGSRPLYLLLLQTEGHPYTVGKNVATWKSISVRA